MVYMYAEHCSNWENFYISSGSEKRIGFLSSSENLYQGCFVFLLIFLKHDLKMFLVFQILNISLTSTSKLVVNTFAEITVCSSCIQA